jgi:hypothetical protein
MDRCWTLDRGRGLSLLRQAGLTLGLSAGEMKA